MLPLPVPEGGVLVEGVEVGDVPVAGLELPGRQGFAAVADVCVPVPEAVALPLPAVVLVLPLPVELPEVLVEGVVPEAVVPLLEGVQGATVEDVPLCALPMLPPVTEPALPAVPEVP